MPQEKGNESAVPWIPGCPPLHPMSWGMWGSERDKGQRERATAPSALPLQEGMCQGVQLVHLLLDLQVGPLAEARGGAGGSPSTHPAMSKWRSAPKCHSQPGFHIREVRRSQGAMGLWGHATYLGHLPDGHHAVQSLLQPLVVLLLHVRQEGGGHQRGLWDFPSPPGVEKHCPPQHLPWG